MSESNTHSESPSGGVYEMASHLLLSEQPFSRNRHYDAYRDRRFRGAIALYRRLRALINDLERAAAEEGRVALIEETREGRAFVRLDVSSPQTRRSAWLDKPAYEVLMKHPRARAALLALTPSR